MGTRDLEGVIRRAIELQEQDEDSELADLMRAAEEAGVRREHLVAALLESAQGDARDEPQLADGGVVSLPWLTPERLAEVEIEIRKLRFARSKNDRIGDSLNTVAHMPSPVEIVVARQDDGYVIRATDKTWHLLKWLPLPVLVLAFFNMPTYGPNFLDLLDALAPPAILFGSPYLLALFGSKALTKKRLARLQKKLEALGEDRRRDRLRQTLLQLTADRDEVERQRT